MRWRCIGLVVIGLSPGCLLPFDPALLDSYACPAPTDPAPLSLNGIASEIDPMLFSVATSGTIDVELQDVDGDFDLELLTLSENTIDTDGSPCTEFHSGAAGCDLGGFSMRGVESFERPGGVGAMSSFLVAPLTGQSPDLVAATRFNYGLSFHWRDDGTWELNPVLDTTMLTANAVAAGDIDGDTNVDLVVGGMEVEPRGRVFLARNGSFSGSSPLDSLFAAGRIWIADFDNDRLMEVLAVPAIDLAADWTGHAPVRANLLEWDGTTLAPKAGVTGLENISFVGPIVVADFDRDGDLDIFELWGPIVEDPPSIVPDQPMRARVLENDRGMGFLLREGAELGGIGAIDFDYSGFLGHAGWHGTAADFDLDGRIDIAWASTGITALLNAFDGTQFGFTRVELIANGDGEPGIWERIAAGDLEGDGDVDIAATVNDVNHRVQLYENLVGGNGWLRVRPAAGDGNQRGIGVAVCVFPSGALPADGCDGAGLLGYHSIMATSSQHAALEASFGFGPDAPSHVDVRVLWPRGVRALVTDVHDVPTSRLLVARPP